MDVLAFLEFSLMGWEVNGIAYVGGSFAFFVQNIGLVCQEMDKLKSFFLVLVVSHLTQKFYLLPTVT